MKARILNKRFIGIYSNNFISTNKNNVINGQLVSEWQLTDVLPTENERNYLKLMFENDSYYEGATPEEIAQVNQTIEIETAKIFMAQKQEDGNSFYNDIDLRITVALSAMDKETLFPKLAEIDSLLYPPLNKIKTGDFASALYLFSNQTAPSDAFVLNFYNEALTFCQTYYDNKYPK